MKKLWTLLKVSLSSMLANTSGSRARRGRKISGAGTALLLACAAVCGALLLILADALAKLIAPPIILPIGAIMSFIGGPVFLILLFRGRNSNG